MQERRNLKSIIAEETMKEIAEENEERNSNKD